MIVHGVFPNTRDAGDVPVSSLQIVNGKALLNRSRNVIPP